MKKLALMVIISAVIAGPLWSIASEIQSQSREQLYVLLGKHCFNREMNDKLYNDLVARGVAKDLAEERASGDFVVNNEFCSRFRVLIETMGTSKSP